MTLLLLVAATAFVVAAGQVANDTASSANQARTSDQASMPDQTSTTDQASGFLSAVRWPPRGQAALVLGGGRPAASPDEQPVPIASLAKVMTAVLTLQNYPLSGDQEGFTVTVTAAQARAEAQDASLGQSVAAVQAGEQLTERQLLEALLIPSGNNIAHVLAARVAGSETVFVSEMNAEARSLGVEHTYYTDPSGWDTGTVSTAADQLRVFQLAMRFPVFDQIVSMASVTLPIAGTLTNTNPILSEGYAGKTGSDAVAGACLAFFTHLTVDGRPVAVVGVVLRQWENGDSSVVLAAAGEAARQLIESVVPVNGVDGSVPMVTPSNVAADAAPNAGKGNGLPHMPVSEHR